MTTDDVFEKVQLAGVYVDDGAFHTAARVLREAADMMKSVADAKDAELDEFLKARA